MQLPPNITSIVHAGHPALHLHTHHGSAIVALHGAHLLSWVPAGQAEVLWVSPRALPEPAPIRGGVPVCWPWFAKQGQSANALQHGPVRGLPWQVTAIHCSGDDEVSLSLQPCAQVAQHPIEGVPAGLVVSLTLTLGQTLVQTLSTRNEGAETFALSQALHSYFSVSDASQVSIEGLIGRPYQDRLGAQTDGLQQSLFRLADACDRTYAQTHAAEEHSYTLSDPAWQRDIHIQTRGSQSVVVWNPGAQRSATIADLPEDGWQHFFCIETCNAGPDLIEVPPQGEHHLSHTLSVTRLAESRSP
jgi:glucose-6-phosphate 1-epimerase